ncbi:activating signal cointegrator 1 complex subunit 2-like protein [Abeliophyllum distichum]|uniref:Activating signal cointegrator 1 complex subunit 2-like protein n=1 Tax=Abeliophyllum distichum TaxID=126358 RepID=A0ABD1RUI5_9LAMI
MDVKPDDERSIRSCDLDDNDKNLPFFKELKTGELSTDFKMHYTEKYNWWDDPIDYINVYKIRLQSYILAVKCRNFYTILDFDTKRWYNKLKPSNIMSWPLLSKRLSTPLFATE